MTSAFTRISENTLFSLLIAAVIGWTVVSVADAATPQPIRSRARLRRSRPE